MDKTQQFVLKAQMVRGNTFDYSKVVYVRKADKVEILCQDHGVFLQTPNNHLNGQGCPVCGREARARASASRAVGVDAFVRRAKEVHGDRYDYSKVVYKSKGSKVTIICPTHGEFQQAAGSHLAEHGCAECYAASKTGKTKDSWEQLQKFAGLYPDLDFSGTTYAGKDSPVTAVCAKHGTVTKPAYYWNIYGCPECGRESSASHLRDTSHFMASNARKHGQVLDRFKAFMDERKDMFSWKEETYVKHGLPVEAFCKQHGQVFFPTPKNMMDKGTGCPLCGDAKVSAHKFTRIDSFLDAAKKIHSEKYNYSKVVYAGMNTKVTVVCPTHGDFEVMPTTHAHAGTGCPSCGQKSRFEEELVSSLTAMSIKHERRNRTLLGGKEIDVYIPEAKLGIEMHGLYWHTEEKVGGLHRAKNKLAQVIGVNLIQVFSDEWETKQDLVMRKIGAMAGKGARVGARKCDVVRPEFAVVRKFLEENHIQGLGVAPTESYGLTHDGELVAVMTFGAQRTGAMARKSGWELLRYATSATVQGGFTKLLAAFKAAHVGEGDLVSFCDMRWGDGRTYGKAGFRLASESDPDYWWLPHKSSKVRVPRYATQKHKLKDHEVLGAFFKEDLSENEICAAAGWKKILGVGQQKWLLTL